VVAGTSDLLEAEVVLEFEYELPFSRSGDSALEANCGGGSDLLVLLYCSEFGKVAFDFGGGLVGSSVVSEFGLL
jgi:hypothetical protein